MSPDTSDQRALSIGWFRLSAIVRCEDIDENASLFREHHWLHGKSHEMCFQRFLENRGTVDQLHDLEFRLFYIAASTGQARQSCQHIVMSNIDLLPRPQD